ncbi:dicarboxylate/amino acid:cation symporter [Dialister hominis]|uniref:dicarboxylate/amino acid:cation symporter n=1 Tax=Dialister hominis TaxID=2582419 RepID=UPI003FD6CD87
MNLSLQIFASLVLSVIVGLVLGEGAAAPVKTWIAPIGTMFINLIKMMIVPVVFCSLVVGMTSMGDMKKLGRIGIKTLSIYMVTTAIAIVIGFAVALAIDPGTGMSMAGATAPKVKEAPSIMQVFVDMIPSNPIASMAKADILPVIIFALFVGAGIISVGGKRAETLISFFDAFAEVCYKIIAMIMKTAPIGVFCLLLPVVVMNGPKVLLPLLSVIICMLIVCTIHAVCVYSAMTTVAAHMSPVTFFRGMSEAMAIAFTTCSSAGTLPVNMKNVQEKLGVHRDIASFVLPLGATINMDGTALYMGVCSIFIANVFGVPLTFDQMMMIVLTGTLASIGTAGVPGAGLIMLAMVLQSVGLPLEGLALVAGIDRVLDMFRTCLNITGDAAVAVVVNASEQEVPSDIQITE